MTLRELLQDLEARGRVREGSTERAARLLRADDQRTPWYLSLLTAAGAWVGSEILIEGSATIDSGPPAISRSTGDASGATRFCLAWEEFGTINKALDPEEIGAYVDALAQRIAQFPAESINACKRAAYESIDRSIDEALRAEAYWLYQATSKTPAVKRFTIADEKGMEHDMDNQRNWNELVMAVQEIE